MKNIIKGLVIFIIIGVLATAGWFVYKENDRISNLLPIEYTGTIVKESTLLDDLLGKPTKYTFTSNTGVVLELTFETAILDTNKTYKLKYTSVPLYVKTFTTKQYNRIKLNNDTYMLESIIVVEVQ